MFRKLLMDGSPVKRSDSHSRGSRWGSQLDLSGWISVRLVNATQQRGRDEVNDVHQGLVSPQSHADGSSGVLSQKKFKDKLVFV